MTIRRYVSQKLQAFNVNEAMLADLEGVLGMSLEEEYSPDVAEKVGVALTKTLEELALGPRLSNVSESGFSMSWDFAELGKYYVYLCKKWGVPANEEVLSVTGISTISDCSNLW